MIGATLPAMVRRGTNTIQQDRRDIRVEVEVRRALTEGEFVLFYQPIVDLADGRMLLPAGSSRVEFRLTPIAAGTRLDLTHTGLPAVEQPKHALGWAHCLTRLAHAATSTR